MNLFVSLLHPFISRRWPLLVLISLGWQAASQAQSLPNPQQSRSLPSTPYAEFYGYYEYLPVNYDESGKHPLLIFFHGLGESHEYNGKIQPLSKVLNAGIPKLINQRTATNRSSWPDDRPFVVISPQSADGVPEPGSVDQFINYLVGRYKVDTEQIYLTGLSAGGITVWKYLKSDYSDRIAAAIPIAGDGKLSSICGAKGVPIWAFHCSGDRTVYPGDRPDSNRKGSIVLVREVNQCSPPVPAKVTIYQDDTHDSWSRTYDLRAMNASYVDKSYDPFDENIYEWLLKYKRGGVVVQQPSKPSNVGATAVSADQIDVTWSDNADNETGFKIERKTAGGSYSEIKIAEANATRFQDKNLSANTQYTYRVRAYNGSGNSAYSSEASATTSEAGQNLTVPVLDNVTSDGLNVTLHFTNLSAPKGPEGGYELILNGERTKLEITDRVYSNEEKVTMSFALSEPGAYEFQVYARWNSGYQTSNSVSHQVEESSSSANLPWEERFNDGQNFKGSVETDQMYSYGSLRATSEGWLAAQGVGQAAWKSEEIDIRGQSVDMALVLRSEGELEATNSYDAVQVYVKIDGGSEQLIKEKRGSIEGYYKVKKTGLQGDRLQVVVRFLVSDYQETYFMDAVEVFVSGSVQARTGTVRVKAGEAGEGTPQVRVYPNPAQGEVVVRGAVREVRLLNTLGQGIPVKVAEEGSGALRLNISEVAPGLYMLQVEHEDGKQSTHSLIRQQ